MSPNASVDVQPSVPEVVESTEGGGIQQPLFRGGTSARPLRVPIFRMVLVLTAIGLSLVELFLK